MGRKSKFPVLIPIGTRTETIINLPDALPSFENYLDIPYETKTQKTCTRLFLSRPTPEQIEDTVKIREIKGNAYLSVIGARMPYMNDGTLVSLCLYDHCIERGFSSEFADFMVRLTIKCLKNTRFANSSVWEKIKGLTRFLDYLSIKVANPSQFSFSDINKQLWLDYGVHVEANHNKAQQTFNAARWFFVRYPPTAIDGWLALVDLVRDPVKPNTEHTSELVDKGYSDAVMYQMLALFLEAFQRRIGYLRRYQELTAEDMPVDWLFPGRNNKVRVPGSRNQTESSALIDSWLNDEEQGYQILIDHFILQHKAGLIRQKYSFDYRGGILDYLTGLSLKDHNFYLIDKFRKITAQWHGFTYPMKGRSIWSFYINKKSANEPNITINQIGWCLANLLMMQTGINKEVALSIPSKGENGKSILEQHDQIFQSQGDESPEAQLHGYKERTGSSYRKTIAFSIVKDSPIYEMLLDYERFAKVDFDGPFFEFGKVYVKSWGDAGGLSDFTSVYPIFDDNGDQLKSINSTKFRKVFASGQLLDRIQNIKDGNELAEKLQADLHHGDIDTTLSHYLMRSNAGRSALDIAIVTMTSEKMEEALKFKGKICSADSYVAFKKVYLCDCEDPFNPSHKISIAKECRHYDLCLGCERSVITKFHLPFICARIHQYEDERIRDPLIWPATFEDLWCIAHDALEQYQLKDPINGKRLVEEAWSAANEGTISLPPIIKSIRG